VAEADLRVSRAMHPSPRLAVREGFAHPATPSAHRLEQGAPGGDRARGARERLRVAHE
jgi:hypothetical protein